MVSVLIKIAEFATVETLLVSMPESLGLLVFGVALVVLAVFTRTILSRGDKEKQGHEETLIEGN